MARAYIQVLRPRNVQIASMGKYRPVHIMRTVEIVMQDNTVLQPHNVQIADQDNIVAVHLEQIVNVILAPRVDIHRELRIQCVHHVVQVNIKILMHAQCVEMGQYQQEKQMQNVLIVSLENKNNPIRTLNAMIVFQANIV